ncbi:MAG: S46 family peptidase [Planctomycetes bacterium]|nr:S46 family peptidase [Planctomycetota bacterium]
MIRTSILLALTALLIPTTPDEGQWLPQQVRKMDWDALRRRGMKLTRDEFWHPEKGGILSAAVQINGCTASFCSTRGLVVTNHHCGFGAVSALSTPEHNHLRDGFVADTLADELPAEGMTVFVVRRIENVTDRVHAAQAEAKSDLERWQLTENVKRQLVAEGEQEPDTTCHVADFFEGREYHLYYRTKISDVRLVYAPPRAVGEFGGEVDNWEWPRHTGDFTFFRAYVGPDGKPAPYSENNVPYEPEHYLRVSADGMHEGDLAIIMGYPGQTERYESSLAIADRQGFYYPQRLALFTHIIDVLHAASERDEETELRYVSLIKSLANVQKNAEGMIWGLARNAVVERKLREEAEFTDWVDATPERLAKYGAVLEDLKAIDLDARKTQEKDLLLGLLGSPRIAPMFANLIGLVARDGNGIDQVAGAMDLDFEIAQRPILERLLDEALQLQDPIFRLDPEGEPMTGAQILEHTKMTDPAARAALFQGGAEAIANSDDPLVVAARGTLEELRARGLRDRERAGRRIAVGTRWIEAQQEWRGTSFYPDANSTMRVSIASVKGYVPRDGVYYTPHTTVAGLLAKETGEEPFANPKPLIEAAENRLSSRYFDAKIGDVPVCFLTDGDTTGGNSGSPVVNGKGELVGLNFDRVFENVSGDYGWNPDRSRNISVDIRYVLWILEQVRPAHRLLDEMGVR